MPDPLAKSFYRRFAEARVGWFRRLAPLCLTALLVLTLGGGSAYLLLRFYDGVNNYRSPLAKYPLAGDATEPLTAQVVLVVIGGLREDIAREMPTLQRLRAQGASATVLVPFAQSQSAWTTLVTGAEAEINDAPLIDLDLAHMRPMGPESLFATVRRANREVAIAAHDAWQPLIAPQYLNEAFFISAEGDPAVADRRVSDAAVGFINNFSPNFMLVYLALPELTATHSGAASEAYRQAAYHTDQLLAQIAAALNLRQATLLVTSAHGHIERGGHGGDEMAVTRVPLVAVGAHIRPGDYGLIRQSDIAPTVAALVGGSLPSASQGSILFSMLAMSDVQRANKALALAKQQREFGQLYLAAIGGTLSEAALSDPLVAKSSLDVKNYESAFGLAYLAAQQVQHDTRTARVTRIDRERVARVPLMLMLIVVPLLVFWFRRSLRLATCAVIALGIVGVQHWLYLNAHRLYSFSDLTAVEPFAREMLERSAVALLFGGVLVSIYHWRDEKPSRLRVAQTLLIACLISIYLASVPFVLGYYVNGLSPQWYIGDLGWAFSEVFNLAFISSLAILSFSVAILVAFAYWLALIVMHRLARQRWVGRLTLRLKEVPNTIVQLFLS